MGDYTNLSVNLDIDVATCSAPVCWRAGRGAGRRPEQRRHGAADQIVEPRHSGQPARSPTPSAANCAKRSSTSCSRRPEAPRQTVPSAPDVEALVATSASAAGQPPQRLNILDADPDPSAAQRQPGPARWSARRRSSAAVAPAVAVAVGLPGGCRRAPTWTAATRSRSRSTRSAWPPTASTRASARCSCRGWLKSDDHLKDQEAADRLRHPDPGRGHLRRRPLRPARQAVLRLHLHRRREVRPVRRHLHRGRGHLPRRRHRPGLQDGARRRRRRRAARHREQVRQDPEGQHRAGREQVGRRRAVRRAAAADRGRPLPRERLEDRAPSRPRSRCPPPRSSPT